MKISKNEIEKIAGIAKIELSDSEKMACQLELDTAFEFIGQLKEVDLPVLDILGLSTDFKNQLRSDEALACPEDERLLAISQVDDIEDGQIKVKRVLY